MSEKPERQRIVEEAIEWMVRLQSGDFSAAEGDALERWKALSSEHAEVFRQLLGSLAPLQDSPWRGQPSATVRVSYTHIRAHETQRLVVCRVLVEEKKGGG
ncbi:FecR/PupR family sigma factor regulator, partial [Pseudomonas aeruginosa]|uniref:FecR/PupR family sigma factor regulator n=1 Tax=Pseudomonas aeruginosa TaxID=287 RepID=UPI001CA495D0